MATRLRGGNQPLSTFNSELRLPTDFTQRPLTHGVEFENAIRFLEYERPSGQNFWPALTLGFISQAEALLGDRGISRLDDVFEKYPPAASSQFKVVNTLTFVAGVKRFGIRGPYNDARNVIAVEMRRVHPTAAAHATQAWHSYQTFIDAVFRAQPGERHAIAEWIWQVGVVQADERRLTTAVSRVIRPFEQVLADMPTQGYRPGGALFQALVFGYFLADSPNLTLESHSVNTGGSHAAMVGDVAGFRGGELELAVEVKDTDLDDRNVDLILSDFLEDLVGVPNATAVVVAHHITDTARDSLALSNVIGLSRDELRQRVITWDLPKQQEALRGAGYYLARVQKNTRLLAVLRDFLVQHDLNVEL